MKIARIRADDLLRNSEEKKKESARKLEPSKIVHSMNKKKYEEFSMVLLNVITMAETPKLRNIEITSTASKPRNLPAVISLLLMGIATRASIVPLSISLAMEAYPRTRAIIGTMGLTNFAS